MYSREESEYFRAKQKVLVEMLAPYKGRVYDPCCGSGGMFVQSEKFIEAHAGKIGANKGHGSGSGKDLRSHKANSQGFLPKGITCTWPVSPT